MRERPILFSGPMMRAIIAGKKTVTRRPFNPQPELSDSGCWYPHPPRKTKDRALHYASENHVRDGLAQDFGPFGRPGDALWVRETWGVMFSEGSEAAVSYEARLPPRTTLADTDGGCDVIQVPDDWRPKLEGMVATDRWRPSIHMPRWASRVTLDVLSVRAERIQDITPEDAIREGLAIITKDGGTTWKHGIPDRDGFPGTDDDGWPWTNWSADPRVAFRRLWTSIYGPESWDRNDWVARCEFRVQPLVGGIP